MDEDKIDSSNACPGDLLLPTWVSMSLSTDEVCSSGSSTSQQSQQRVIKQLAHTPLWATPPIQHATTVFRVFDRKSIILFIPKRLWRFQICVLKVPRWALSPAIFPRHLQELTRVLKETGQCLAHGIDRTLSWQVDFLHTRSWQRILSWLLGASGLDWQPNAESLSLTNVSGCGTSGQEALQVFNVFSVFLL